MKTDSEEKKEKFLWDKIKVSKEQREKALIIFLLGVFFLLAATPVSTYTKKNGKKTVQKEEAYDEKTENDTNKAYIDVLENKLEQIIGNMEGAGRVQVMVTLKNNGEKILDKNQSYESIVTQELYPEIEGVFVICEGGDNRELTLRIKEAVQALFSIDAHKIVVYKFKK